MFGQSRFSYTGPVPPRAPLIPAQRPSPRAPLPVRPPARNGGTYTGTVKSYNAKGFGFILAPDVEHDVYFSREELQQGLRTCNIAGTIVSFELTRGPGGKPLARNLRPVHGVAPGFFNASGGRGRSSAPIGGVPGGCSGPGLPVAPPSLPVGFTGFALAEHGPRRSWSPHAGSRAIAGLKKEEENKKKEAKESSESSQSSSDSSDGRRSKSRSRGKRKQRGKRKGGSASSADEKSKKGRKRRRSSSSSSSSDSLVAASAGGTAADGPAAEENRETEDAKKEALNQLTALQAIHPKEARMKEWRALLRAWHPDKNPDKVEVATSVFQFLQKGKALLDLS